MARALLITLVLPLGGCLIPFLLNPCGGGECPEPDPVTDGLYSVEDPGREDVVDAVLEVAGDTVVIEYVDDQGNTWEVEYAIVERWPE